MKRLKDALETVGVWLGILLIIAVMLAGQFACSELWKTGGTCDPQTAYNHCEDPGPGPGPGWR